MLPAAFSGSEIWVLLRCCSTSEISFHESQSTRILSSPEERIFGKSATTEDYGQQLLLARRFAERGVRFIQCTHSRSSPEQWDQHRGLKEGHERNAAQIDRPIAGLLKDLKSRGMLDETLVLWGGEFGRTPTSEGKDGRDHHPNGFTMWMAGGGVKGGYRHGETDEYGYYAIRDKVTVHDLHATILYLLGLYHEKLTFRHDGREFRLTDVYGNVARDIIA